MSEALAAKLEPKIIEACAQFIRSDPETLRQVVGSIMGVKIPRKTLDDMVMETIGDDPTLRREWAENRLQQMKRNGRSEMDIVGEGLDMFLKVLQEWQRAAWPQVVNNVVVTGEFRETLLGLASLWKGQAPKAEGASANQALDLTMRPRALSRRRHNKNRGPRPWMGLCAKVIHRETRYSRAGVGTVGY